MQRREFLGFSIAAGLSGAGLPGCRDSAPLRFGILPWVGYEPLYLARDFNWLPETVALVPGASAKESMEGLLSGALDGAALTLDETLRVLSKGIELVVVVVTDVSVGADVLMVRPEITELAALKGKRVAVELNGVSGIMLLKLLRVAGLDSNDVTKVDLPVSEHAGAWSRGEVEASVCYEPTASVIENSGGVRLFDSSDIPETIFDVLVVTRTAAKKNARAVRDLVSGHFAGLRHLVRSMHDSVYRIATRQGISPDEVREALASVMLPDLAANQRYLSPAGRIETTAGLLSRLMLAEGMIDQSPRIERLSDPSFLPAGDS